MSLWEYKVITSGKGGFATPALLEKFLNDLGRDEWEIVHFQTLPDNFLAFTGLARRTTQRDWTLQDAATAAAKAEADKLRAEFEAKFKAASSPAPVVAEERAPSLIEEQSAPEDGFRKPVDTSHDDEPEAPDDESDDWDKLTAAEHDELPTFFDAIKPHMRRNQRGPGMSVGVDYLAKKWDQTEDDLRGALVECGFVMPEDEDSKAEYVEFDGDLYWLNINRRGELWINTKEKPRPVFRSVKAARIEIEAPAPRDDGRRNVEPKPAAEEGSPESTEVKSDVTVSPETGEAPKPRSESPRGSGAPLPEGVALLDKIRPHMRRNRRGPGGSGSTSFLARALRTNETDLKAAFVALGLTVPVAANDKPAFTEIGQEVWWLNLDSRGGLWINGREKLEGETAASRDAEAAAVATGAVTEVAAVAAPAPIEGSVPVEGSAPVESSAPADASAPVVEVATTAPAQDAQVVAGETAPVPAPASPPAVADSPLAAARLLLKEGRTGSFSARVEQLAGELGKSADDLVASLVGAGLKVPEKAREKTVSIEHAGEKLWLSRNAKGELWLNAKAAKSSDDDDAEGESEKAARGSRARGKKTE
jgi:hypothetical protein